MISESAYPIPDKIDRNESARNSRNEARLQHRRGQKSLRGKDPQTSPRQRRKRRLGRCADRSLPKTASTCKRRNATKRGALRLFTGSGIERRMRCARRSRRILRGMSAMPQSDSLQSLTNAGRRNRMRRLRTCPRGRLRIGLYRAKRKSQRCQTPNPSMLKKN